jgi:aryl-alcohol dehydrogenase-like predicted oxidoreductase
MGGRDYGAVDDDEMRRAVDRAIELGITLFDTAPAYGGGYAEAFLGRILGSRRERVVLITKGGLPLDSNGRIVGRDSRADALVNGLDDSLRRLRTDFVDVFLVHWPDRSTPWEEAMAGLNRILESGKARDVGVSNFHAAELERCRQLAPLVVNQVAYNLFDRRWEREMFPTAHSLGVGVAAYSPLAHGLLSGHYRHGHTFAPTDWRAGGRTLASPDVLVGDNFQRNLALVERLRRVAEPLGLTVAQLALAWVLRDPLVATAITSPRRVDQVEESVGGAEIHLPDSDVEAIDRIAADAAGLVERLPE